MEAWIADPRACCDKAGVAHPANLDEPTSAEHELEVSSHSALSPTEPVSTYSANRHNSSIIAPFLEASSLSILSCSVIH